MLSLLKIGTRTFSIYFCFNFRCTSASFWILWSWWTKPMVFSFLVMSMVSQNNQYMNLRVVTIRNTKQHVNMSVRTARVTTAATDMYCLSNGKWKFTIKLASDTDVEWKTLSFQPSNYYMKEYYTTIIFVWTYAHMRADWVCDTGLLFPRLQPHGTVKLYRVNSFPSLGHNSRRNMTANLWTI